MTRFSETWNVHVSLGETKESQQKPHGERQRLGKELRTFSLVAHSATVNLYFWYVKTVLCTYVDSV